VLPDQQASAETPASSPSPSPLLPLQVYALHRTMGILYTPERTRRSLPGRCSGREGKISNIICFSKNKKYIWLYIFYKGHLSIAH
jgi:hypothetical protein